MIPETYLPGFTYGPLGGFGTKPVKTKIRLNDQDKSCVRVASLQKVPLYYRYFPSIIRMVDGKIVLASSTSDVTSS